MLVLSQKCEKQLLWMLQSYFKVLLQNCVWNCSSAVHYPFRMFLMSCPICTVTAKNSSMSHFVISGRGKMRIVLSLASPSTVSNTGLFVPPLDGCNARGSSQWTENNAPSELTSSVWDSTSTGTRLWIFLYIILFSFYVTHVAAASITVTV